MIMAVTTIRNNTLSRTTITITTTSRRSTHRTNRSITTGTTHLRNTTKSACC
jgi:hypothetical protein